MAVTIYEALALIEKDSFTFSSETIPIENGLGRVSAKEVVANIALPTFNNSAMDGYGLKGDAKTYKVVGKILAGDAHSYELNEGECIKILTGARVPESVDTIIPQENTSFDGEHITIEKPVSKGANIRNRGEDIDEGDVVLPQGEVIDASHIGLLASQGITHVEVFRKVRIGVFASGSELKLHFERLESAQIFNSNTPYLLSRCKELGCETRFVGKSEDSVVSLKKLITSALDCDIIVTSGGVSVGEADFTKAAFGELGMETLFEKVMVKPGKPTTFGKIGTTFVLNLPGNPLASALNFEIFGKFLIHRLSGKRASYHNYIEVPSSESIASPRPVANIIPGTLDGKSFTPLKKFAPGNVNVLNRCNGMIVIDAQTKEVEKGNKVKFLPIKWDFLRENFEDFMS